MRGRARTRHLRGAGRVAGRAFLLARLPATVGHHFACQRDHFRIYHLPEVNQADVDNVAMRPGVEGDLLVGQQAAVQIAGNAVQIPKGRHASRVKTGKSWESSFSVASRACETPS